MQRNSRPKVQSVIADIPPAASLCSAIIRIVSNSADIRVID